MVDRPLCPYTDAVNPSRLKPTPRASDWTVVSLAWLAVRLPFLRAFDLVSHDGTFYVDQARHILAGDPGGGGAFPPGYPLLIALVRGLVGDGVRAAQLVSALAALAAAVALYEIARRMMPRWSALLCAVAFTATPALVRVSLTTMSESAYVAWVLLAVLAYERGRRTGAGLLLGAAAVTRPEALGIAAAVVIADTVRRQRARDVAAFGLSFLAVYSLVPLVPLLGGHAGSWLPKADQLGSGARLETGDGVPLATAAVAAHYVSRLSTDLASLFRHTGGLACVLGVVGMTRRPGILLAALVPLVVNPLFTTRPETRFVVPFIPVVIVYAFAGAATLAAPQARRSATAALVVFAAVLGVVDRSQLTTPESKGFAPARAAAAALRGRVAADATVADRKPFLSFYLGAHYAEIPPGPYRRAFAGLDSLGADYLALERGVTDFFRPAFAPLLYDAASIRGEPRLRQIYADAAGISVFRIVAAHAARDSAVAAMERGRSCDGASWLGDDAIVYAAGGVIYAARLDDVAATTQVLYDAGGRVSDLAPSGDGSQVAFVGTAAGNPDVVVLDVATRTATPITRWRGRDIDPAWDADGSILFASDREGVFELFRANGAGNVARLTSGGGNRRPAVAPGGGMLAWTRGAGALVVRDRASGGERVIPHPHLVVSAPSWDPRSTQMIACTARDLGANDVYIVDVERGLSLRLPPMANVETGPDWGPYGRRLLVAGLDAVRVLAPLADTVARFDAPPDQLRVHARAAR